MEWIKQNPGVHMSAFFLLGVAVDSSKDHAPMPQKPALLYEGRHPLLLLLLSGGLEVQAFLATAFRVACR